jgi:hypothetical protein
MRKGYIGAALFVIGFGSVIVLVMNLNSVKEYIPHLDLLAGILAILSLVGFGLMWISRKKGNEST